MDFGAELKEAPGHRFAEPGAAAGDKDTPAGEELLSEHVVSALGMNNVNWLID